MALSRPRKLGDILGSGCSFGRHFLANSAETIQHQLLKTVTENMCSKNSRETGTENVKNMAEASVEDLSLVDKHYA